MDPKTFSLWVVFWFSAGYFGCSSTADEISEYGDHVVKYEGTLKKRHSSARGRPPPSGGGWNT